jgi:hypothetical protein
LKNFLVNHKDVKSLNQNNYHLTLSKILIKKIKDIQISKEQKTTQDKQKIIQQMKIKGLAK